MTSPVLDASNRTVASAMELSLQRLRRHTLALFLVLAAMIPILGGGLFSADEGAGVLQAKVLAETGQWRVDHPWPAVDPSGEHFSLHLSAGNDDGYVLISRTPVYTVALATVWKLIPHPMMLMLLSAIGTTAAAAGAARLSQHLRADVDLWVLWGVGLVTPLCFDSQLVIAHAIGAGFAAWAAVFLLGPVAAPTPRRSAVFGAIALAGLVLARTEGILAAAAIVGALGLYGLAGRRPDWVFGAVLGAAAAGSAFLVDRAAAEAVRGVVLVGVGGTNPATTRTRSLSDQLAGLDRTWFWARSGGIAPIDYLLALAIIMIAAALILARQPQRQALAGRMAVVGAVLATTKFLSDPAVIIPGLIFAFPLVVFGAFTLRRSTVVGPGGVLLAASVLFSLAVLATQYREGGSAEFGGRYFALALPLIAPVLFVAVVERVRPLPSVARQRMMVGIALVSLTTIASGIVGLAASQRHSADLIDQIEIAIDDLEARTSGRAVVLTTQNPVGRFAWDQQDDAVILLVRPDELPDFADRLAQNGVRSFALVTSTLDSDLAHLDELDIVDDRSAWPGSRWHVVTLDAA